LNYDFEDFKSFRIVFLDVKGVEVKQSVSSNSVGENSVRNDEEIKVVEELYRLLINRDIENREIKILSPYRSQVSAIRRSNANANVSTVVTSQGGEWNFVILSTVRTLAKHDINPKPTIGWRKKHLGFLIDEHQINVAITRAKRGLFLIGD
jgi:superfamily I DNA and/or RNA helicase